MVHAILSVRWEFRNVHVVDMDVKNIGRLEKLLPCTDSSQRDRVRPTDRPNTRSSSLKLNHGSHCIGRLNRQGSKLKRPLKLAPRVRACRWRRRWRRYLVRAATVVPPHIWSRCVAPQLLLAILHGVAGGTHMSSTCAREADVARWGEEVVWKETAVHLRGLCSCCANPGLCWESSLASDYDHVGFASPSFGRCALRVLS
jgi:hypothetical protein